MTRREAAALGQRFFDAARPCKWDGSTQRYVSNRNCVGCAKRVSREENAAIKILLDAAKRAHGPV